ncbi:hypothetical protein CRG98_023630 [Punica granatum]|uniref:Uncharacterized protein n=1 Tax=Punica granatum TaxID=22663 RepID=A0A2I0JI85_PUNGR|nr:hypothetical protein CRG98_023630 [Punica granatum]
MTRTGDQTRQGCMKQERAGLAKLRSMKVNSHGRGDPARLQEARASKLSVLAKHESKLARTRQDRNKHEPAGSAILRNMKLNSHRRGDPARLQEARASKLSVLAKHESKLARTRQDRNKHEPAGSAILRNMKLNSHRRGDPARLQEARASKLSVLAKHESKLARTRQDRNKHEPAGSAILRNMKLNSHRRGDPARLQEARASKLSVLAKHESKLARTRQDRNKHEPAGSAILRNMKLNSHRRGDPARLQEARASKLSVLAKHESKLARTRQDRNKHEPAGSAILRNMKLNSHRRGDPARLQEARASKLSVLAKHESKLARTRQDRNKHEPAGSAILRNMKLNSHRRGDPARWQEARASSLGELAKHESELARSEQTKQHCNKHEPGGSANLCSMTRTGDQTRQGCMKQERVGWANSRSVKVNLHV